MKKRVISILVCLALGVTLFAGCGSNSAEKEEKEEEKEEKDEEKVEEDAEKAEEDEEEGKEKAAEKEEEKEEKEEEKAEEEEEKLEETEETDVTDDATLETTEISEADYNFDLDNIGEHHYNVQSTTGSTSILGESLEMFAALVEEMSDGKITFDRYLNGELETGGLVIDNWKDGLYEVSYITLEGLYYMGGATVCEPYCMPFLFNDYDQVRTVLESDLGDDLVNGINEGDLGMHVLGLMQGGARDFFAKEELNSYKDLAGLKIRVQSMDTYTLMASDLGASATALDWSEVYSALSTGMVDAAENPISGYYGTMLYEEAPNLYESQHIFEIGPLAVSDTIWDTLNDDEKALFEQAADEVIQWNWDSIVSYDEDTKEELINEHGVTVVTPGSDEKQELFDLMSNIYDDLDSEAMEVVEEIRAMGE